VVNEAFDEYSRENFAARSGETSPESAKQKTTTLRATLRAMNRKQ